MAAVQSSPLESLEVRESGRALKVQTNNPHLVSIGSGRLSTNVTWHPLPEGKIILLLKFLILPLFGPLFLCKNSLMIIFNVGGLYLSIFFVLKF